MGIQHDTRSNARPNTSVTMKDTKLKQDIVSLSVA